MATSFALQAPHALPARARDAGLLRRVATAAVIALLAVQAARLAWLLLVPPAPVGAAPTLPRASIAAARPERLAIDAFHPAQATAHVTADSSGLRLHAARPAAGAGAGAAIIAGKDGRQQAFVVGDEVAPGVVLVAVAHGHVTLAASGTRSELRFAAPAGGTPSAASRQAPAALPAARAPAPTGGAANVDPAQLLAQAGLRPVQANDGQPAGYSVIPRGDGAVLRQAGLQAGDVLLSVNGQALTPERYAALPAELAGSRTITLTYARDGTTHTTTLQADTP
nr:type II secretion system protein N [Luteimonas sp. MC1782]